MRASSQRTAQIVAGVALAGAVLGFLSGPGPEGAAGTDRAQAQAPARTSRERTFVGLDPLRHRTEDGATIADLADGSTAVLSIHPGLQAHVAALYARYEVPAGALVAMDPRTGRVLAYVSHAGAGSIDGDLVLDPSPPAASVFKIVTGAALVDAGVDTTAPVCYHGGSSRLTAQHLEDDPARDRTCASLTDAMGGSINAIFAKLADRHLPRATLERYASAFGFGHALPFDVPTRTSPAEVPDERLEYARTAAGFWHMHMSPLHGALIAATVANGGRMPRATIVDEVLDPSGHRAYRVEPSIFRSVIPAATAQALNRMMQTTVTTGTAHRHFFDERGNAFLPGIAVAGKTGSLTATNPYRDYSWFVGFAPADAPEIAVAALVINEPRWRIKAAYAAREALRYWLVVRPREERRAREAEPATAASSG